MYCESVKGMKQVSPHRESPHGSKSETIRLDQRERK